MKTLCCFAAALFSSVQFSLATVRTLSNMPFSPGQYTTFADAQISSDNGDTIYVHGSNFNYGDIFIGRPLVVIGTGHNPNKQSPRVSAFHFINIQSDGVQLIGLTFNGLSSSYRNCTVKKCRIIDGQVSYAFNLFGGSIANWLIEGNIFEGDFVAINFNFSGAPNTVIDNNIFANRGSKILSINNNLSEMSYVLNNVFLCDNGSATLDNLYYVTVNNNIFYGATPHVNSVLNSSVNNNISFQCADNSFPPGSNNLVGIDPQFVNYPGPPALFDYAYDFSLQSSSPGHNTGTDGTDRGVFGGIGFLFSMTGEPSIAEITAFTITSPTVVPPGGTLDISITSKSAH